MNFTPASHKAFAKAYAEAVKTGNETFIFEDKVFLTAYAKYVLEWLDSTAKMRRES
jgi:hypothetical protein